MKNYLKILSLLFFVFIISCDDDNETAQLVIKDFNPKEGKTGDLVKIDLENFNPNNNFFVYLNDKVCSVKNSNNLQIEIELPANIQSGQFSIVYNSVLSSSKDVFIVNGGAGGTDTSGNDFSITDFFPKSGKEGTEVIIIGKGFPNDLTKINLFFNGTKAQILEVSENIINSIVPTNAQTGPIIITSGSKNAISKTDFIIDGSGGAGNENNPKANEFLLNEGQSIIFENWIVDSLDNQITLDFLDSTTYQSKSNHNSKLAVMYSEINLTTFAEINDYIYVDENVFEITKERFFGTLNGGGGQSDLFLNDIDSDWITIYKTNSDEWIIFDDEEITLDASTLGIPLIQSIVVNINASAEKKGKKSVVVQGNNYDIFEVVIDLETNLKLLTQFGSFDIKNESKITIWFSKEFGLFRVLNSTPETSGNLPFQLPGMGGGEGSEKIFLRKGLN